MKLAHLKYVIGSINNKEKSNLKKITNSKMKQSSLCMYLMCNLITLLCINFDLP